MKYFTHFSRWNGKVKFLYDSVSAAIPFFFPSFFFFLLTQFAYSLPAPSKVQWAPPSIISASIWRCPTPLVYVYIIYEIYVTARSLDTYGMSTKQDIHKLISLYGWKIQKSWQFCFMFDFVVLFCFYTGGRTASPESDWCSHSAHVKRHVRWLPGDLGQCFILPLTSKARFPYTLAPFGIYF